MSGGGLFGYTSPRRKAHKKMTPPARSKFEIDLKIPLTWLLASIFSLVCSLVWAGWQAKNLDTRIAKAIEVGSQVMAEQATTNRIIVDHDIKLKMQDAQIQQIDHRVEKLENRK